ncbi:MAG: hypothetical protein AB1428_02045 [Bacteroidota bacterium]
MNRWIAGVLLVSVLAGCGGTEGSRTANLVNYHMRLADSLEQEMALKGAAEHYVVVATEFPQSTAFPVAARKAALLYASEFNPARNDSLALYWFTACLNLPMKKADREHFQMFVSLLRRVRTLQESLARKTASVDSLTTLAKRQSGTIMTDMRRLQDLEADLQQVQQELKRMKEIDVKLSKSRTRK